MKPYFTIIVPNYNNCDWLDASIGSIVKQNFKSYELIIVDDCSTDNSIAKIKSYCHDYCNIHLLSLTEKRFNGGSRNAGYDYAKKHNLLGKYVLFLDSDDWYVGNNVLQDIYDCIQENNEPDCVRLSYQAIRGDRVIPVMLNEDTPAKLVDNVNVACWLRVIKTEKWVHQPENNLMEDAVANIMQCDNIDTVVPIGRICISWNRNNTNSCSTHPEAQNNKWKSSLYRYIADLMDTTCVHDYCERERQLRLSAAINNARLGRFVQDK